MTGDGKPGDAIADKWREEFAKGQKETDLALTRLEIRAEQRSQHEEEDTGVIHTRAAERVAAREAESDPPSKATPTVIVLTMVRKFPAWGAVLVALAAIAAYVTLKLVK